MTAPGGGTLRIAAWNIEWFPDHTDIDWLACAIAWLDPDLLALVEIRATPKAQARMVELIAALRRITGDPWQVDLQSCGARASQHVGFLWNASRLRLIHAEDVSALNPRAVREGDPCAGHLRPGRLGYFRPNDGIVPGFHAIAVHLKSGASIAARNERERALERLAAVTRKLRSASARIVVLGDFNTMGDGSPLSAAAEVRALDSLAARTTPMLERAEAAPACSEYYRGKGVLLDHVLVSRAMGAVAPGAAQVSGYCALAACAPIRPWRRDERPAAYRALSDHCPIVVQLADRDRPRTHEDPIKN